ncbi:exported hypothetical protein [Syntrophobacter sp. SbD1]|nr:exported hypothetical protein [Syntrophobacter sp. SbD1]
MKTKSTLIITCLALAVLLLVAPTTRAEAQCCGLDILAAPFVAAGAIVYGAVAVSAAVVTAPFTALSCGTCGVSLCNTCGFNLCNPCGHPTVSYVPGNDGRS